MTETIDITPTWEATVQICVAVLENKNAGYEAKQNAIFELKRLAKIVDKQNTVVK